MVFSSIPAYLDPSQWHQQANHQSAAASSSIGGASSFQFISHTSPPPPPAQASHGGGGGGGAGSIRPGSMVDRARMANLPMPESALKCPRCESTNTKFCYFNNYSLSQPRHFCKTCRRYWTRGGALRSVPVGGGYRRNNKRPSKSNSKSPVNSQQRQVTSDPEASSLETQIPSSKFISPLHHQLTDGDHHRMSLNYSRLNNYSTAISAPNNGAGGDLNFPNFSGFDQIQWRLQLQLQQTQQPPLLATSAAGGLFGSNTMGEASSSYHNNNIGQIQQKMEEAKMEENGNEEEVKMGIGRQFLGVSGSDNHHYWSGFAPSYSHT